MRFCFDSRWNTIHIYLTILNVHAMKKISFSFSLFSVLCLLAACKKDARPDALPAAESEEITARKKPIGAASVSVLYKGLNNPRGLKFGPDGYLYVAEAGTGGTMSTAA